MKVLVIGATGAVGLPLVSQLVKRGHEVVGTRANDATDVEGVADLAVERPEHRPLEPIGVRAGAGHEPRAARAVEADGHAGLPGDGSELRDGWSRPPGDGEGQEWVREEREARGM